MAVTRTSRTEEKEGDFLASLRQDANVSAAARLIDTPRRTVYEWREDDETFAKQWDEAVQEAMDAAEAECRRRAVEGIAEPVFYQGEETGSVQRYSDTLLIFYLKSRRPEVFRDNLTINVEELDAAIARRLGDLASRRKTPTPETP